MALKIFSNSKAVVGKMSNAVINFPNDLFSMIRQLLEHLAKIRENLKDLTKTNLRLGKYHFYSRNLNDAFFRFRLVDRFFDPGNQEACYYLGWCFFRRGNYSNAVSYLERAGDADIVGLKKFIDEIDVVDQVPSKIEAVWRDVLAEDFLDRFASSQYFIPTELVNAINSHTLSIPERYSILELGSNVGICGAEMRKRLPEEFYLTGVENSGIMAEISVSMSEAAEGVVYNEIINYAIIDHLKQEDKQYHLVVSLDGFGFTRNLADLFWHIKQRMLPGGTLAFVMKTAHVTKLDTSLMEFCHDIDSITSAIGENDLKIELVREIKLEKNRNYSIFIVRN